MSDDGILLVFAVIGSIVLIGALSVWGLMP
jgi:hypothetical protein